jgi:hypothetical protein
VRIQGAVLFECQLPRVALQCPHFPNLSLQLPSTH